MNLKSDPKYPIHRMYVVKLNSDATPDALYGRVENLVSGKQLDFTSARELCRLLKRELETSDHHLADESMADEP